MKKLLSLFLVCAMLLTALPLFSVPLAADTYENMPEVPNEQVEYVCPNSTFTAHTLQFAQYDGEKDTLEEMLSLPETDLPDWTGIRYLTPYPNSTGITVLEDKLWINELVPINPHLVYGDYEEFAGSVLDNLYPGHGYGDITSFPDVEITPIVVLDTTKLPTGTSACPEVENNAEHLAWANNDSTYGPFLALLRGIGELCVNGSIVDRSWFPDYLLDFRIYNSAYIDLEQLGGPADITVYGFALTNCSRETYWQEETAFLYAYYTTQKRYDVTLQIENNISVSHYYDVKWYVGYPANRVVDPSTLTVYDVNNAVYLTLGENYDSSNSGVWMAFPTIDMGLTRTFTFSIYSWNATIGLGVAIAYADTYGSATLEDGGYFKASPTWTNNYGRVYQGQVNINLDLEDGAQRYIDPSDVRIYDSVEGRWLEAWEFVVSGGLMIVDYAIVTVGSAQSYDVYFHLDLSSTDSLDIYSTIGGVPLWGWLVLGTIIGVIAIFYLDGGVRKGKKLKLNGTAVAFALVMLSVLFILWYFYQAGAI